MKTSSIKTVNPATGKIEKEFQEMYEEQINQILDKAVYAFQQWKITSFEDRAEIIHTTASLMREKKEDLAKLCAKEMGKILEEGIAEVELCANILDYYADKSKEFLADKPIDTPQGKAFISYEPIGVILSVQPWNFPFYQLVRSSAPNIMAGNTMVMKHASNVPQCAEMMEKLFLDAGLPKGVYTNLFIPGSKVSNLAADDRIKGVALTGSEPAGASLASAAGKNIKKSTLELGGSDPFIVLEDADIDSAVEVAAYGRLWNAGQVCVSPKRIIVMESFADQFIQKSKEIYERVTVGDPLDPTTNLAPLSSQKALEEVISQVEKTVSQGAKLVFGGKKIMGEGAYMEPTILTGIKKGMLAYSDEIFGPVLCIYSVKNEAEAIELANDTEFGLGATIFSKDINHAVEVARKIDTGMVFINELTGTSPELPFGGTKQSGYGKELSELGIYEFVNEKLIRIAK
ncbi:NAD-dependent succinate-semialdehyde dehydrogenase [Apibacter muscae]|uniref:NAD-dependent succinate-semialdehyde dehydrogenase n=1 Tax=Apibacter muscae TaxID=2509004 RepID=A0A563D812_9FLAO|nr:NAD-dependent succinate-semialdehyde dehydrogenase [Apibacter muscae]TWP26209.1 NAD-dependent succinate-semialdehyde dehydrogenase [Apibacter muscae]